MFDNCMLTSAPLTMYVRKLKRFFGIGDEANLQTHVNTINEFLADIVFERKHVSDVR